MGNIENVYISKKTYRKVEKSLRNYFKEKKEIENIRSEMKLLEKTINQIEDDIKNTNVKIDYYQEGLGISERVQTSCTGTGYAEKALVQAITKMEKEIAHYTQRLNKLRGRIRIFENNNERMSSNLEQMKPELRLILKYKYQEYWSDAKIANKVHTAQSTVCRNKKIIILNVAQFMHWF